MRDIGDADMDKRTRSFIAKGAAVLGLAAAGAAAYKNDEKLFALGIRRSFGKNDVKRDAGLKAPEDVVRVTDLAYAVGAGAAYEASTGTAHEASAGTAREASAGAARIGARMTANLTRSSCSIFIIRPGRRRSCRSL